MKKVVITGATGAIGRSLIHVCIESGYEVLAVVHRSSPRAAELERMDHCRVLRLDLDEYDHAMEELEKTGIGHDSKAFGERDVSIIDCEKVEPEKNADITLGDKSNDGMPEEKDETRRDDYEFFFHLAWMAPFGRDRDNLNLQLDNIRASLAAVKFARDLGCGTFVGTGSQAENGRVEGVLSSDTPAFPETGYGITKLCAGQMTRLACEQLGLRHIWCRVLSVYGPYDRDQTLISTAVIRMMADEETEFTPCDQMWDYIYSDDAARAILLSAQRGESGSIYMIGSGEVHPLREYIEKIAEVTGYTKEIGFGRRPYNDKQVMYLQADVESLKQIGFERKVSFEEGIKEMISWQLKRKAEKWE